MAEKSNEKADRKTMILFRQRGVMGGGWCLTDRKDRCLNWQKVRVQRSASDRYVNSTKAKCRSGWGNISMETVGPNTRLKMLLLLMWVLLWGPSAFGSPLEIQLLDMMLREAEGYPSNGRSQRDIDVLPAASIGCDESSSQEEFSNLFDDYEESKEECLEFLPPCEPSFQDGLPIDHPCFVKLLLLRTPLLKQDPCANFSLIAENPITTTVKPKSKKCNPRRKAKKSGKENVLLGLPNNRTLDSTTNAPIISTTTTAEPNSKIINIRKLVPRVKPNTTSTTTSTTTTLETTTVEETTTPQEETTEAPPETTTELETTTTPPSTTSTTTTTQPPFTANQLKRLKTFRERQKSSRRKSPNVPDPPQIKLDNVSQPSEVIQVIMTTEAAELKLKPEVNTTTTVVPTTTVSTTTSKPETTTVESCEDEVEATKVPENSGCEDDEGDASDQSENKVTNTTEEPCEDTDEQDTNLCPQFMPTQGAERPRPPPPYRFRKPVKNYVEPILYEGNFAKPLQRMPPMGPQQRDYFVTNKQIVPKPRPKYRKRIPPSIYMNNIVRGLDCSDEVSQQPSRTPNQPQMSWDVIPAGLIPRLMRPERKMRSFAPTPIRRNPSYPRSSEEMMERQYQRERHLDPRPQYHHFPEDEVLQEERSMPPATPTPSLDPCQQEHDHILYSQRPHRQQTEHLVDYPQPPTSSHFFT